MNNQPQSSSMTNSNRLVVNDRMGYVALPHLLLDINLLSNPKFRLPEGLIVSHLKVLHFILWNHGCRKKSQKTGPPTTIGLPPERVILSQSFLGTFLSQYYLLMQESTRRKRNDLSSSSSSNNTSSLQENIRYFWLHDDDDDDDNQKNGMERKCESSHLINVIQNGPADIRPGKCGCDFVSFCKPENSYSFQSPPWLMNSYLASQQQQQQQQISTPHRNGNWSIKKIDFLSCSLFPFFLYTYREFSRFPDSRILATARLIHWPESTIIAISNFLKLIDHHPLFGLNSPGEIISPEILNFWNEGDSESKETVEFYLASYFCFLVKMQSDHPVQFTSLYNQSLSDP